MSYFVTLQNPHISYELTISAKPFDTLHIQLLKILSVRRQQNFTPNHTVPRDEYIRKYIRLISHFDVMKKWKIYNLFAISNV